MRFCPQLSCRVGRKALPICRVGRRFCPPITPKGDQKKPPSPMKDWMVFVGLVMWLRLWLWRAEKRCPFCRVGRRFCPPITPKGDQKKPPNPVKDWMVCVGLVMRLWLWRAEKRCSPYRAGLNARACFRQKFLFCCRCTCPSKSS